MIIEYYKEADNSRIARMCYEVIGEEIDFTNASMMIVTKGIVQMVEKFEDFDSKCRFTACQSWGMEITEEEFYAIYDEIV